MSRIAQFLDRHRNNRLRRKIQNTVQKSSATKNSSGYRGQLYGKQIRLLRVLPGNIDQELECEVLVYDLSKDTIEYNALSYVWGDTSKRENLVIDGQQIAITESLHSALMAYRLEKQTRLLWADALCIDFEDNADKSRQVAIMREVYQRAKLVIIWLGEELPSDLDGLKLAERLVSQLLKQWRLDHSSFSPTNIDYIDHEATGIPAAGDPSWQYLMTLLSRDWFRRVWIVQEFVCAQKAIMWCGSLRFDPMLLIQSARLLVHHTQLGAIVAQLEKDQDQPLSFAARINHVISLLLLKERQINGLSGLLYTTRRFQATHKCDKVFALVGMAYGIDPTTFVDYRLSDRNVFIKTARFLIHDNLDVGLLPLSWVMDREIANLPTWVPDWSPSRTGQSPLTSRYANGIPPRHLRELPIEIHFPNHAVLAIQGKLIDTISILHPCPYANPTKFISSKLDPISLPAISTWLDACDAAVQRSLRYETEAEKEEALWRTIIFDSTHPYGQFTPDSSCTESYRAYRLLLDHDLEQMHEMSFSDRPETPGEQRHERRNRLFSVSIPYLKSLTNFMSGRQFCVTTSGHIGWVSLNAQPEDKICIFQGYPLPFLVRPSGQNLDEFELIGDAYVHGLMNGEAINFGEGPLQTIKLI